MLLARGAEIFPPRRFHGLRRTIGKALYDTANLRAVIKEAIPTAEKDKLGQLQVPLLLPSVDWTSSRLQGARQLWGPAVDIVMISIGTANVQHGHDAVGMPQRGSILIKPLLDVVMAAQEVQAVTAASRELGVSNYLRLNFIQPPTQQMHLGLDVANAGSSQLLQALGDECVAVLAEHEKTLLRNVLSR